MTWRWPPPAVSSASAGAVGGVKSLYDIRIFLEAALVRHAAKHARKEDIEAPKQALDANEAAIPDSQRFYCTDVPFTPCFTTSRKTRSFVDPQGLHRLA